MTEPQQRDAAAVAPTASELEPTSQMSYGARLSSARQRAGLTVTDIAARLRLHPNQVRAIEQENLAALPELAYVRGFVRSYARILQLDPAPLLADLQARTTAPAGSVIDGMTGGTEYSPVRAAAREKASKRLVIGIAIITLILLGAIGWYASMQPPAANEAVTAAPGTATPAMDAPTAADSAANPTTNAAMAVSATSLAASDSATTSDTASAAVSEPATEDAAAGPAPAPLLRLQFNGASWVQVTDAGGRTLLSGVEQAGASRDLQGALPLSVIIGDAGKVDVEIRGAAFDVGPVTRSNVARFRVE